MVYLKENFIFNQFYLLFAFLSLAMGASACNKVAYNPSSTVQKVSAPGTYYVPPKVDILLIQDDTGSGSTLYPSLQQQLPQFLSQLDSLKWDYHFATIPLTQMLPITQVAGSVYDSNWGTAWQPPYPGAAANGPGTILASDFRQASSFTGFLSSALISDQTIGQEPGFQNIQNELLNGLGNSQFLRTDSLFVMMVMGNGNDTSGVNFCNRGDGDLVPCDEIENPPCTSQTSGNSYQPSSTTCSSGTTSLNYYSNWFQTFNANTKFYAAVSSAYNTQCLATSAYEGSRYIAMSNALGGKNYDICSQSIANLLTDLSTDLQAQQLNYRQHYAFFSQQPQVSSIQVTLYPGGNTANPQVIPQSSTNGWTYVGMVNQVYTIDSPVPMNLASGYAIEFNGTAEPVGADTIALTYVPAALQSSVSN